MYLSMVCPSMRGGGEGATPGKLTFKLAPWEGILTVKYLLICINCKGLYGNSTSGEHSGEGNLRFSSRKKSNSPGGAPPHTLGQTIDRCITFSSGLKVLEINLSACLVSVRFLGFPVVCCLGAWVRLVSSTSRRRNSGGSFR